MNEEELNELNTNEQAREEQTQEERDTVLTSGLENAEQNDNPSGLQSKEEFNQIVNTKVDDGVQRQDESTEGDIIKYIDRYENVNEESALYNYGDNKRIYDSIAGLIEEYEKGEGKYTQEDYVASFNFLESRLEKPFFAGTTAGGVVGAVMHGMVDAGFSTVQFFIELANGGVQLVDEKFQDGDENTMVGAAMQGLTDLYKKSKPNFEPEDNHFLSMVRGITQFALPYGLAFRALRISKVGLTAANISSGIMADTLAFSGEDSRISTLIQDVPLLENPITEYLRNDDLDSELEGRLKNAIEGLLIGGVIGATTKHLVGPTMNKLISHKLIKARDAAGVETKNILEANKSNRKAINQHNKKQEKNAHLSVKILNPEQQRQINELNNKKNPYNHNLKEYIDASSSSSVVEEELLNPNLYVITKHQGEKKASLKHYQGKEYTGADAIKATLIQRDSWNHFKENIPLLRDLLKTDTEEARGRITQFITDNLILDNNVKTMHRKAGAQYAMFFRSLEENNIPQINKFREVLSVKGAYSDKAMGQILDLAETSGDYKNLIFALTASKGKKFKKLANSVYKNSLLSAPKTLITNIVGTFGVQAYRTIERLGAGIIGETRAALFGGSKIDKAHIKEAFLSFQSQGDSLINGISYWKKLVNRQTDNALSAKEKGLKMSFFEDLEKKVKEKQIHKGPNVEEVASAKLAPEQYGFVKGDKYYGTVKSILGIISKPSTIMELSDALNKILSHNATISSNSYHIMYKAFDGHFKIPKGVSAAKYLTQAYDDITKYGELTGALKETFEKNTPPHLREIRMNTLIDEMSGLGIDAIEIAKHDTFTNDNILGDTLSKGVKWVDEVVPILPVGSIVAPFIRTPLNLIKWGGLDHGLLALTKSDIRAALKSGGREADLAMAKVGIAGTLQATGLYLAINGKINSKSPINRAKRELTQSRGIIDNSIIIGNKSVSLNMFNPVTNFLLFPARVLSVFDGLHDDLVRDLDNGGQTHVSPIDDITAIGTSSLLAFIDIMANDSSFNGIADIITAVGNGDQRLITSTLKVLERQSDNFFSAILAPNIVSSVSGVMNTLKGKEIYKQAYEGMWEKVAMKYGANFRDKTDIFGQPVKRKDGAINYFVPIEFSNIDEDPVLLKMELAGAYITRPKPKIRGVQMTKDEYADLMEIVKGMGAYQIMKDLVMDKEFNKLSTNIDGGDFYSQKEIIIKTYKKIMKQARSIYVRNNIHFQKKLEEKDYIELNLSGRTTQTRRITPGPEVDYSPYNPNEPLIL